MMQDTNTTVGAYVRVKTGFFKSQFGYVEQVMTYSGDVLIRLVTGGMITVPAKDVTVIQR